MSESNIFRPSSASSFTPLDFYSEEEELANTISHSVGLILSCIGLIWLLGHTHSIPQNATFGIYGISVLVSYLTSTVYHGVTHGRLKHQMRMMDHAAIYLQIAGTYTPFLIMAGSSWLSSYMLVIIWLLAIVGALFKLLAPNVDRYENYAVLSYLSMGWIFPLFVFDVYALLPPHTLTLLLSGGVIYSVGILFYRWESLPFNHALWHGFVLFAGGMHFVAIYRLLLYL